MAGKAAASDLESGLGAFAYELDREVAIVDHGDEKVAFFTYEPDYFAYLRCADPVQLFFDDGGLYTCDEELGLVQFTEVEEVYAELDSCCTSPCEDVLPQLVKARLFHVHHDIDCGDFAHLQQTGRYVADELADLSFPENMSDLVEHLVIRLVCFPR